MNDIAPHIPVMPDEVMEWLAPKPGGRYLDATLGLGGHTARILELTGGRAHVLGLDRDENALAQAKARLAPYGDAVTCVHSSFRYFEDALDEAGWSRVDGVIADLGVSSVQLDSPERGFSFQKDGPLDMRMSQEGRSAADLVNETEEGVLANVLYLYGEERASRRIARAIVEARKAGPITTTLQLTEIVARCLPRPKPGQSHPATRSFQAIRIAVNAEFDELAEGLAAAERALKPGGRLAVVTFHSLEDRIVKRYLQLASGHEANANRYAPARATSEARFEMITRRAVGPDDDELAANPRARSAKLRVARRTAAPPLALAPEALGVPQFRKKGRR